MKTRSSDSATPRPVHHGPPGLRFRIAGAADADVIATLHAESWRRNYRGAYSDEFLDGDVHRDRVVVWNGRLRHVDPTRLTILALT